MKFKMSKTEWEKICKEAGWSVDLPIEDILFGEIKNIDENSIKEIINIYKKTNGAKYFINEIKNNLEKYPALKDFSEDILKEIYNKITDRFNYGY